jgi:cytochrome P450
MDPPEHNRHRKLVISAFTPKRVGAMEAWIRGITKQSLDAIDPRATVEFVDQIAVPLPMFVIADMLGVPRKDHVTFRRWSDRIIDAGGGILNAETAGAVGELIAYVEEVTRERRHAPEDDLISRLVEVEIDDERLTDHEIGGFCLTLLVAGNETTRNLISAGALALMRNPEQREKLLDDPGLLPNAVEEMLRFVSPLRTFVRYTREETQLRGRTLREGDYVALFYSSANRDEEVFGADADAFDITRESAPRHVAFGFGEHFCLGASLARLETQVMFEELLQRWPRFELAGEPELLASTLINGVTRMPVTLEP